MALTSSRAAITRVCAELAVASADQRGGAASSTSCGKAALAAAARGRARGKKNIRLPVESEVGFLYARLVFGHVVKGACLLAGGAAGAGVVALARKEDSEVGARLTFLGVAAGEAARAPSPPACWARCSRGTSDF